MEARVQILPIDKPTANDRVYPRSVVEEAIRRLNGRSLAVTHVNAFLKKEGVPTVADSLGVASDLVIDEATQHVIAHVRIEPMPPEFEGKPYVIRSAGFGTIGEDGKTITDFTMSAVVIANE